MYERARCIRGYGTSARTQCGTVRRIGSVVKGYVITNVVFATDSEACPAFFLSSFPVFPSTLLFRLRLRHRVHHLHGLYHHHNVRLHRLTSPNCCASLSINSDRYEPANLSVQGGGTYSCRGGGLRECKSPSKVSTVAVQKESFRNVFDAPNTVSLRYARGYPGHTSD